MRDRHDRRSRGHAFARLDRARCAAPGRRHRPGRRPRGAALLLGDHRTAERRDAHASQPRGESDADRRRGAIRFSRTGGRAAVFPHLRHGRDHESRAHARRDRRDAAAFRARALPESAAGLADRARARGAADRRRAREAPGRGRVRPARAQDAVLGRGAARRRAHRSRSPASRRHGSAGLRHDGGEPGHALHRTGQGTCGNGRSTAAEHRVSDRGPRDGLRRRRRRARRGVGAGSAGNEGLPRQRGSNCTHARRGRLAAHG